MDMVEQSEDERIADAYLESAYDETGLNGTAINWRYWVHQMPVLSAAQAACLMSALEPDLYASLNGRHGQDDPARNITKARKIQRLAEANGKLTASPDEWIAWAKAQRISVHTGFLLAVGEPKAPAPSEAPEGDEPTETPATSGASEKNEPPAMAELPARVISESETSDTTGMVAWQAAVLESWSSISKKYNGKQSARQVMAWCKTDGHKDVFGCVQPLARESMTWIDSTNGNVHTVTLARIGTVISEWRTAGIIPAKK